MGGDAPPPPSNILIPRDTMKKLASNPFSFILEIPLVPNYHFTGEEVNKLEGTIKGPSTEPLPR